MKLRYSVLLAAACIWTLFACSSAPKIEPAALQSFTPEWSLQKKVTVQTDKALSASVTVDTTTSVIYAPQGDHIVAYDARTGAALWRTASLGRIEAPITISLDGKSIIALVQGKEALNLDSNSGKVLWRAILPVEAFVKPLAITGIYVILAADGRVYGLESDTGRRRWAFARNIPSLTVKGSGSLIALPDNVVLIGMPGGKGLAIKGNTGQTVWEVNLAESFGVNEVERISDVLPHWQAVTDYGYCASTYRNRIACVDKNGKSTFSQDASAASGLVFSNSAKTLSVITDQAELKTWSIDTTTKSKPWVFEGLRGKRSSSFEDITAYENLIVVSDTQGYIHGVSAKTGLTLARTQTRDKKSSQLWSGLLDQKPTLLASTDKTIELWTMSQLQK